MVQERNVHMRIRLIVTTLVVAVASTMAATSARAFDLTGHWVGKYSCKGFAAPFTSDGKLVNKFTTGSDPSTLVITQNGATFGAIIDPGNGTFRYNAFAMTGVKDANNGEVVFLGCSTGNTLPPASTGAEILRASVKTKAGTFKASFKGISIFADDFPEVETCKYTYKRVDTNDPGVDVCQ
jgi:hypothetical protein